MSMFNDLASEGRNGDTLLAHISTDEAQLLKDHGGSGTINPETGIMEFNIFSDLWNGFKSVVKQLAPVIIPAVAIFVPALIPAIGTYLGASAATASVIGAAALSAGVTLASGGSLKDVLTSAALAGASTYLTPIVGKALTFDGASQLSQIMAGSAAVGAGYTAMRGGTVKEMIAAAGTGATAAYLGSLAKEGVAKMNNMMASGKVTGTITEKGATDATFAAADAANLKAAGLSQAEISKTLQATGMNAAAADYAATSVTNGMDTSTLAANLGAGSTGQQIYNGEANTKSIVAGNNAEMVQRVEDAKLVAQDAAQLKAQGLSQADIRENLLASGVDANTAASVAYQASTGQSADQISQSMINGSTYLTQGHVYTNSEDTIARDLGQAMDAEQIKEYKALPFKDMINNGQMTIDEAAVLGQHGISAQQATDLSKLGYTPSDLDNMIGAGVTPQTLTQLAATKFPESNINDMLQAGVSANDISNVSGQVNAGKVSVQTAETLLTKGLSGQEVTGLAINGKADQVASLMDKGLTEDNFRKMYQSGTDFAKVNDALDTGKMSIDALNGNVASNTNYNSWINQQEALAPTKAVVGNGVGMVSDGSVSGHPAGLTNLGGGVYKDAAGNITDFGGHIITPAPAAPTTPVQPSTTTATTTPVTPTPVTPPPGTIDVGGGNYMDQQGNITDANGNITHAAVTPSAPVTQTANNLQAIEAHYNELIKQGYTPAQAMGIIDPSFATRTDTPTASVDVGGSAGFAGDPSKAIQEYRTPNTDLATQEQIDNRTASYNAGANAWEVPSAPVQPETPFEPIIIPQLSGSTPIGLQPSQMVQTPTVAPSVPEVQPPAVTQPEPVVTPTPVVPTQPVVQPPAPVVQPPAPVVTQPEPVVQPPVQEVPVTPQQPQTPTVVSSSTRTTYDGSIYQDNQMSDGTVTTTQLAGPSTGGTGAGTTTGTITPQPPLSPPVQEVIPPGSSYVAPVEVTPPPTTPSTPTETTPTEPVTPYVPILTPEPTPTPSEDTYRGHYTLGAPIIPNIPHTLNPGWITNVPAHYQTTNQAQAQYYWGGHPYQTGTTFNPTLYNQTPNAPTTPFGLGYAQTAATPQQILQAMGQTYPLLNTVNAPVRP